MIIPFPQIIAFEDESGIISIVIESISRVASAAHTKFDPFTSKITHVFLEINAPVTTTTIKIDTIKLVAPTTTTVTETNNTDFDAHVITTKTNFTSATTLFFSLISGIAPLVLASSNQCKADYIWRTSTSEEESVVAVAI